MLRCINCPKLLSGANEFCDHLKTEHQMCGYGSYQCALCNHSFSSLRTFRIHLIRCWSKKVAQGGDEIEPVFLRPVENENIAIIKLLTQKAAGDFVCKLAGNMSVSRNSIFKIIRDVTVFLTSITDGMKTFVMSWDKNENVYDLQKVISLIHESLQVIKTEKRFDKYLSKEKLISPLRKVQINDPLMEVEESEEDSEVGVEDSDNESENDVEVGVEVSDNKSENDDDVSMEEGADESEKDDEVGVEECDNENETLGFLAETVTLMPIQFQFKSFFELPTVFDIIKLNSEKIKKGKKLNHFINGKLWKSKLKNYNKEDVVIPYYLHIDDTQTNNPVGTHKTKGDITCVYYTIPTIPDVYSSRLDNIFTGSLFESRLSSQFGNERCFKELVEELNKMADNGILLNIDGKEQKVFFVMGLLLGDNKGLNDYLGYAKTFSANYYCRICRLHKDTMQFCYEEDRDSLRNKRNYEEDLQTGSLSQTGLSEYSVFNNVRHFHATQNCVDVMHDVNQGILNYNICEILLYFIENKFFTLKELNQEKRGMKYGETEENNRSSEILKEHLKKNKLLMTASETHSFVHHLPFMLGNIAMPRKREQMLNSEVWKFLLITIRFVDMCYLPYYDASSIDTLRIIIKSMHKMYVKLFNTHLKPKHHFAIHYPSLIIKLGPLRFFSSIRFEANHKFIKNYTKNVTSRKNIAYSLGRKIQYNFAYLLKNPSGLKDNIRISKSKIMKIDNEDFFQHMSHELDLISGRTVCVSDKVIVNGLTLSSKLYLPYVEGNDLYLFKLMKIIVLSKDEVSSIRIICKKFEETIYCDTYGSYQVKNLRHEMQVINISSIIYQRMYPVMLHDVAGASMFRLKYF